MANTILIVDDDELITKSLSLLLSNSGYKTVTASNGAEAIATVKETSIDLIICDVRMPELDGIETIEQIRAYLEESDKKPIPEILISGYTDEEKHKKAMSLKVVAYLLKPLDNDEFLYLVKKTIP